MKYIFRVKHLTHNEVAEIHAVKTKDSLETKVLTNNADLEFDLKEILSRPFTTTLPCCDNKNQKDEIFLFVPPNSPNYLAFIPDILSWHGYIIEDYKKVSHQKSLSIIEEESLDIFE